MWPRLDLTRTYRKLRSLARQMRSLTHSLLSAVEEYFGDEPPMVAASRPPARPTIAAPPRAPARPTIERLTRSPDWDYGTFRQVMIALGTAGPGVYVPAHSCPRTIDILRWAVQAERMQVGTTADGRERGMVVLADTGSGSLILGRTHRGSDRQIRMDATPQSGREPYQCLVGSIHTHPATMTAHGLSPLDYESFLSSPALRAALVVWGEYKMLVLKTSATPEHVAHESLLRHIRSNESEVLASGKSPILSLVDFNRAMCTEFGLAMYTTDERGGSVLARVQVTL